MATTNNLGRVQGGGFYASTSYSETNIPVSSVNVSDISPLVGDTIINANGAECRITAVSGSEYIVTKYGTFRPATSQDTDAVHFTPQTLTADQQGQARANIEAQAAGDYATKDELPSTVDDLNKIATYGYVMSGNKVIDATGLDENRWYPVTVDLPGGVPSDVNVRNIRIEVFAQLYDGDKPSWSTHESGFSCKKIWETNAGGWGSNVVARRIIVSTYDRTLTDPIRGINQRIENSNEYFYVRGGGKYLFRASSELDPVLNSEGYTWEYSDPSRNYTLPVLDTEPEDSLITIVDTERDQTIGGQKTFTDGITAKNYHDFISAGNEFNFVPSGFSNNVNINYRTSSGSQDGSINNYVFWNSGGGYADITAGKLTPMSVTVDNTNPYTRLPLYFGDIVDNGNGEKSAWFGGIMTNAKNGYGITTAVGQYRNNESNDAGTYIGMGWDGDIDKYIRLGRHGTIEADDSIITKGLFQCTANGKTSKFGQQNGSWCHFDTDAESGFYFGNSLNVNGDTNVYAEGGGAKTVFNKNGEVFDNGQRVYSPNNLPTQMISKDGSNPVFVLPYVPYVSIEPNHNTFAYFKELLKWICQNYPNVSSGTWIGRANPNAAGQVIIDIYNTSITNSEGLPQYSTGTYRAFGNTVVTFETNNYVYVFRDFNEFYYSANNLPDYVQDYGNGKSKVYLGYQGNTVLQDQFLHFAVYTPHDGDVAIKDMSAIEARKVLGVGSYVTLGIEEALSNGKTTTSGFTKVADVALQYVVVEGIRIYSFTTVSVATDQWVRFDMHKEVFGVVANAADNSLDGYVARTATWHSGNHAFIGCDTDGPTMFEVFVMTEN